MRDMGFWPLFLAFCLLPVLDIWILLQVGRQLGPGWTVFLVLATGSLGAALARSQGLSVWNRVQRRLQQGEIPGVELLHALLLLVGGVVLLTPGFITDLAGLALLVPPLRDQLVEWLLVKLRTTMETRQVVFWSGRR